MPRISSIPSGFHVATSAEPEKHFEDIALDLGVLGCDKSFTDVTIHCRNKTSFKVNKLVLCNSSKVLAAIFATNCECNSFTTQMYDILCPDFEPEAMSKVLELVFSGKTSLNLRDEVLNAEIKVIIKALLINIILPEIGLTKLVSSSSCPLEITIDDEPEQLEENPNLTIQTGASSTHSNQNQNQDETLNQDDSCYIASRAIETKIVDKEPNGNYIDSSTSYMCKYCDKLFSSFQVLQQHISHHLTCSQDQNKCNDVELLEEKSISSISQTFHQKDEIEIIFSKFHRCGQCDKTFSLKIGLDKHKCSSTHVIQEEEAKTKSVTENLSLVCKDCQEEVGSLSDLEEHKKQHFLLETEEEVVSSFSFSQIMENKQPANASSEETAGTPNRQLAEEVLAISVSTIDKEKSSVNMNQSDEIMDVDVDTNIHSSIDLKFEPLDETSDERVEDEVEDSSKAAAAAAQAEAPKAARAPVRKIKERYLCRQNIRSMKKLMAHIRKASFEDNFRKTVTGWVCILCKTKIDRKSDLIQHMHTMHSKKAQAKPSERTLRENRPSAFQQPKLEQQMQQQQQVQQQNQLQQEQPLLQVQQQLQGKEPASNTMKKNLLDLCSKCNGRKSHFTKRKSRCMECSSCMTSNCKKCKYCTNPHMKKSCVLKDCQFPILPKCNCKR